MKITATLAGLVISVIAVSAAAGADAVSDQQKAYKALRIDPSKAKPGPGLCKLLSKAEVERFLGEPVHDGTSPAVLTGCAWHTVSNVGHGLLITRSANGGWYPPTFSKSYKNVTGVGRQAFTNVNELGYEASARDAKGTTYVLFSGTGSTAAALSALRLVMKR
jgi:hypothetical protein